MSSASFAAGVIQTDFLARPAVELGDLEIVSTFMAEAIASDGEDWGHEYMWLAM